MVFLEMVYRVKKDIMKSFQISDEMGKLCSLVKYGKIECPSF